MWRGLAVVAAALLVSLTLHAGVATAQVTTTIIADTANGTGAGQVNYAGDNWSPCTGCLAGSLDNSYHFTYDRGAVATIRFTGTDISIQGVGHPNGGIASVAIDGGQPTLVDTYAPVPTSIVLLHATNLQTEFHTATIVNTGQHSTRSPSTFVAFDLAVVGTDAGAPLPAGFRSGLPWLSGTWANLLQAPSVTDAFCQSRGTPCDLANVFVARNSWASIVEPSFAQLNYANWPGRLVITVPPFPEGQGNTLATCATGAYDAYWRTFGNTLNTTGRQNSIIRLAWEANGNWYEWSATDPTAYINCFRHIVTAIRSTATPDPTISWAINAHYSQNPPSHNPLDIYPGDAWVDVVSIDNYDQYPASHTYAEFTSQANAQGGITWLYNFARSHGKKFAVSEWGVSSGNGANGGGDNPDFISWMYDWFRARAGGGTFLDEMYFNVCSPGNVGSNLNASPTATCVFLNPKAAVRYRELWSRI
ncbi:glycosyl hydrolase [Frankia sp. R82]|uniref:glycoside hydrolase family 26 protein n=1 Tax=Frankia sp. R82 TaxID=2950553 RepID=UPI0020438970|nr:glycosyl hydrolase [Frankia sp. R82]MCM3885617.1 beta-mannanase [Frankia sp. R82]